MTLRDFIAHPTKGMRAYTEGLRAAVAVAVDEQQGAKSSSSQSSPWCALGLPGAKVTSPEAKTETKTKPAPVPVVLLSPGRLRDVVDSVGLPLYIFSGVQQVCFALLFIFLVCS
jgi:hypothetical protein